MFQYAFGRASAAELDRELVLDFTSMPTGRGSNVRPWELSNLAVIPVRSIALRGLDRRPSRPRRVLSQVSRLGLRALKQFRVDEPSEEQLLSLDRIPRPIAFLVGYWQSHFYFDSISAEIRNELQPTAGYSNRVIDQMRRVADRDAIAVHVRRGDYVTEPNVARVHGVLGTRFYEEAVYSIAQNTDRPVAVVVSDDPEWASANLSLGIETIHAEQKHRMTAVETLSLMAACSHHVIANSSLSWWGAYLATHRDQQVAYPERWFVDRIVNRQVRFPAHWRPCAVV